MSGNSRRPFLLEDLPWDDIVYAQIFPFLDVNDLGNMVLANTEWAECVSSYLKKLKDINWNTLSPKTIEVISRYTENLESLSITSATHLMDTHINRILVDNRLLTNVSISSCSHLTVAGTRPLIKLQNLVTLTLERNAWANDDFFQLFSFEGCTDSLRQIKISTCSVSDAGLVPFFGRFSGIQIIELENLILISTNTLRCIVANCKNLLSLRCGTRYRRVENS